MEQTQVRKLTEAKMIKKVNDSLSKIINEENNTNNSSKITCKSIYSKLKNTLRKDKNKNSINEIENNEQKQIIKHYKEKKENNLNLSEINKYKDNKNLIINDNSLDEIFCDEKEMDERFVYVYLHYFLNVDYSETNKNLLKSLMEGIKANDFETGLVIECLGTRRKKKICENIKKIYNYCNQLKDIKKVEKQKDEETLKEKTKKINKNKIKDNQDQLPPKIKKFHKSRKSYELSKNNINNNIINSNNTNTYTNRDRQYLKNVTKTKKSFPDSTGNEKKKKSIVTLNSFIINKEKLHSKKEIKIKKENYNSNNYITFQKEDIEKRENIRKSRKMTNNESSTTMKILKDNNKNLKKIKSIITKKKSIHFDIDSIKNRKIDNNTCKNRTNNFKDEDDSEKPIDNNHHNKKIGLKKLNKFKTMHSLPCKKFIYKEDELDEILFSKKVRRKRNKTEVSDVIIFKLM